MTRKLLVASIALALAVVTGVSGVGTRTLSAHAATGSCQTTVLAQTPVTGHNSTHGYLYLMRNLCDGNVFLRISTDLWYSDVTASLTYTGPFSFATWSYPTETETVSAKTWWGGHADTTEVPYTSGATYAYSGYVSGLLGDTYYGGSSYYQP